MVRPQLLAEVEEREVAKSVVASSWRATRATSGGYAGTEDATSTAPLLSHLVLLSWGSSCPRARSAPACAAATASSGEFRRDGPKATSCTRAGETTAPHAEVATTEAFVCVFQEVQYKLDYPIVFVQ
jgi:hypothetical protein